MKELLSAQRDIDQGKFKPIYLLTGDEPYIMDQLAGYIQQRVMQEEHRGFNEVVLYGRDTTASQIAAEARRYPMMTERVLVLVREAQDLRGLEDLENYAQNPQPSTVLVLLYKHKKVDKRKKVVKLIQKQGGLFEFKKLYDNKIPEWINAYLRERNYNITPKASQLLLESLGSDLGKIDNELQKLLLIVPANRTIDDAVVEENIGISKDFNNFELHRAIGQRDLVKALQIQKYMAANIRQHPLVVTLAVLFSFFSKLMMTHQSSDKSDAGLARLLKVNPYFVTDYRQGMQNYNLRQCAQIIGHLRQCDRRAKGVGNATTDQGELLRELLYQIICLNI